MRTLETFTFRTQNGYITFCSYYEAAVSIKHFTGAHETHFPSNTNVLCNYLAKSYKYKLNYIYGICAKHTFSMSDYN